MTADYIWEISSFAVINVTSWSLWIRDVCEISFAVINVTSWTLWIWEMDPEDLNCRLCVLSVSLLCYCHFWTSVSTRPITALSPPRQPIASLPCRHMTWCRPLAHVIIQKLQCADVSTYSIQHTQTHFIQYHWIYWKKPTHSVKYCIILNRWIILCCLFFKFLFVTRGKTFLINSVLPICSFIESI